MTRRLEPWPQRSPHPPTEERPGRWRTRWRGEQLVDGRRPQYTQRFYGDEAAVRREFRQWIKRWRIDAGVRNPAAKTGLTIADLCVSYLEHAQRFYTKRGKPTSHVWNIQSALQRLIELFGDLPADELTPPRLARYRDSLDQPDARRNTINAWLTIVRQAWSWGAEQGHVHPDVALRLTTVKRLQRGRCRAGEPETVAAVAWETVADTLPELSPTVSAMVQIQWHTGMRPGEVCVMRTGDLDTSGDVWLYRPTEHKGEHHQQDRVIAIGPQGQAILEPYLRTNLAAYLFSPRAAARQSAATSARRTMARRYTSTSYRRAIHRACGRAFPPEGELARQEVHWTGRKRKKRRPETLAEWQRRLGPERWQAVLAWQQAHRWSPHQLRHAKEAALEKSEGLEAARLLLGHSGVATTAGYGQSERERRELDLLRELALRYG
ncbi:MAG: tyrosine-type recombinase/integrase [Phycisphaeraceae bacterium]